MATCQSNRQAMIFTDIYVWKYIYIFISLFPCHSLRCFRHLRTTKQTDSCPALCPKSATSVVSEDCIFYLYTSLALFLQYIPEWHAISQENPPSVCSLLSFPITTMQNDEHVHTHTHTKRIRFTDREKTLHTT